jgi:7-carboxy-7-deazaguanine synthase
VASIRVSEVFASVQGEGKLTGVPSVFIRTSGCNLRCRWCDTPYASWNPEGESVSVESLVDRVRESGLRHAVLTGGEPMIAPGLPRLCELLRGEGVHVTVETAGTVAEIGGEVPWMDLASISPKLADSTPWRDPRDASGRLAERHERDRLRPGVIQRLMDSAGDFQLKFVVSSPAELGEIESLVCGLRGWRPADVLLMPEGTAPADAGSVSWVVEACVRRGWRYCHRVHIELFGNTRGT